MSNRDGNGEIYVMNADGSNQTRLTNLPGDNYQPSFSGDCSKIAFTSDRDGYEIYVMNADGSNQIRLTNNLTFDGEPSFSGDGSKIAFTSVRDDVNGEIYVMNADGSNQTRLTNNPGSEGYPSFSGDGRKIAFLSTRDGNAEIYVMNADGSNQTRLTNNSNVDSEPSFSRDGSKIAFVSDRLDFNYEIYVMNADGSNQTRLSNNPGFDVEPSFSGDGSKIAFTSEHDGRTEIYVINADGSNQTQLTTTMEGDNEHPSFGGYPNPVIFVHGVSGSRLVDGPPSGDELWLGPLSNRRRLNLFPNGNPPPSPNIRAVDILRTTLGQPVYGPLLDFLTTVGGYHEYQLPPNGDPTCDTSQINPDPNLNPNLFEFVYDWRKELGATGQRLKTFVECVEQFHPGSKINILTHSMGSLVARRYILDNPTDHNVDRLVTIGAPWLGAPKLLYAMESGEFIRVHGIPIAAGPDIKYIMPSLTAAHQLLSSRAYQTLGGAPIFSEEGDDYDGNGLDHELYDHAHVIDFLNTKYPDTTPGTTADQFHSYTTAHGAQDDWRTDTTGVAYFHFYGVQFGNNTIAQTVATTQVACNVLGGNCTSVTLLDPRYTVGDGTVPARSASRRGQGDFNAPNAQVFRMTNGNPDLVEHTGLTQNPDVQSMALTLLKGGTLLPSPFSVSRATAPDGDSSVPSYYISIIGGNSVVVSDTHGHSTAPILGDVLGTVPGVETFHMGDNAEQIALPVSAIEDYSITFNSTGQPMTIKVVKGLDNHTPTDIIRYQDLVLPANVTAQLMVTTKGVQNLRYDKTVVEPTIVVSGTNALDVTAPTLSFSESQQDTMSEVTITAADNGSGVHDVNYSTDGTQFQPYGGPLTLDPGETPVLYAFATDNVGNRSSGIAYTLAAPPIHIAGLVRDEEGGPIANVALRLTGSQTANTQTDATGHYSFSNIATGGNYVLTATKTGFTFTPQDQAINNPAVDLTINFTGQTAPIAVSRKTHGTSGAFDIDLPLTGDPGIECRSGGVNDDYQLVITFPSTVTFDSAAVTAGVGSVSGSSGGGTTTVTVDLTGVTNAQRITVTLVAVDNGTYTSDLAIPMGVLVGDTNGNGAVSASDVGQTKAQSGQTTTGANFRTDVNASGSITAADIALVKSKSGTTLPP
jgi:pimeloyl-ACP methyl ester carboxylesterase